MKRERERERPREREDATNEKQDKSTNVEISSFNYWMENHFCECNDCGYHHDYMFIFANFRSFRVPIYQRFGPVQLELELNIHSFCVLCYFLHMKCYGTQKRSTKRRREREQESQQNDDCDIEPNALYKLKHYVM